MSRLAEGENGEWTREESNRQTRRIESAASYHSGDGPDGPSQRERK